MKILRDAVHGDVELDDSWLAIIDTPGFQRLRSVRQLGFAHLVYPSALHTRFEHSIGAAHVAIRLFDRVRAVCSVPAEADVRRAIGIAALLHDVSHVSYGHTLEDERRLFPRHDRRERVAEALASCPRLGRAAGAAFSSRSGEIARAALLSEPHDLVDLVKDFSTENVCGDFLDYLRRDAFFTGLAARYDERIFDYLVIRPDPVSGRPRSCLCLHKAGRPRKDTLSELVNLFRIRYYMTERVYYHHTKCAAGAMLSKAIELENGSGDAPAWTPARLASQGDDEVVRALLSSPIEGVARIGRRFASRTLHKAAFELGYDDLRGSPGRVHRLSELLCTGTPDERAQGAAVDSVVARRRDLEERIGGATGIPAWAVAVSCPHGGMQLKETDVLVETRDRCVRPLNSDDLADSLGADIRALNQRYRELWTLRVFVDREHVPSRADDPAWRGIREACRQAIDSAS